MNRKRNVYMTVLGLTALMLAASPQNAEAKKLKQCGKKAKQGSTCLMKVKDLHPTQFSVGKIAVTCKSQKILKKHEKGKLDTYLAAEKRHVPAVVAPDGKFYITDHHHLTTAVYRAGKDSNWESENTDVYVNILYNYRKYKINDKVIKMGKFWDIMAAQNNVYPYDAHGKKVKNYGEQLPDMDMDDLTDNPYRSLSR